MTTEVAEPAMPGARQAPEAGAEVAPMAQRLVLVLPSTGEFDSRTYRIATTAVARGHDVTVVARWQAKLPLEEMHAAGYRIIRVAASSVDRLPFRASRSWFARRLRTARGRCRPT